jgi:hypothetical protein
MNYNLFFIIDKFNEKKIQKIKKKPSRQTIKDIMFSM